MVTAAAVGAGHAFFAASQAWEEIGVRGAAPRAGAELLPWLPALALAALAGAGAILATRGAARTAVGGLLVACGLGIAGGGGYTVSEGAPVTWPLVAALGGLAVLEAGVLTLTRGRSWPGLSSRYERRPTSHAETETDLWDALDRGEDPTVRDKGARD